jgi:hypothetical protein
VIDYAMRTHLCHSVHRFLPGGSRHDGQSGQSACQLWENLAHIAGYSADQQRSAALAFTDAKLIDERGPPPESMRILLFFCRKVASVTKRMTHRFDTSLAL